MDFWILRKPHSAFEGKEGNVIYVAFSQHDRTIQHPQDLSNVVRSIHAPSQNSEPVPSLEQLASSLPSQQDTLVASLASLPSAVARYQEGVAYYQRATALMQASAVELQQIPGFQPAQRRWYNGLIRSYTLGGMAAASVVAYTLADHFQSFFGAWLYPSATLVFGFAVLGLLGDVYHLDHPRNQQMPVQQPTPSSSIEAPSAYPQAQYPSH